MGQTYILEREREREWRRAEEEGESYAGSTLRAEPDMGLHLITLTS